MYFHFHNFTLPSCTHNLQYSPRRIKQGSHTSTQLRDEWPYGTNQKLAISLILRKIIKNVICACQFFGTSRHQYPPLQILLPDFRFSNYQNWTHFNTLPFSDCQSKVLRPSLSKLFSHTNHFLKFISLFQDRIYFLSHVSHICLSEQMKFHTFSTFWLDLYTLSPLTSVSYMFSWPSTNYFCHSQTSAFFTTSGPYVSDSTAEVSHALLPVSEKI